MSKKLVWRSLNSVVKVGSRRANGYMIGAISHQSPKAWEAWTDAGYLGKYQSQREAQAAVARALSPPEAAPAGEVGDAAAVEAIE